MTSFSIISSKFDIVSDVDVGTEMNLENVSSPLNSPFIIQVFSARCLLDIYSPTLVNVEKDG